MVSFPFTRDKHLHFKMEKWNYAKEIYNVQEYYIITELINLIENTNLRKKNDTNVFEMSPDTSSYDRVGHVKQVVKDKLNIFYINTKI